MNVNHVCRDCLYYDVCQDCRGKSCRFFYSYETGDEYIAGTEYEETVREFFDDWNIYETLMSGDARDDDQL